MYVLLLFLFFALLAETCFSNHVNKTKCSILYVLSAYYNYIEN